MSVDLISLKQYVGQDPSVAQSAIPPSSIVPDSIAQALPTVFKKQVIRPLGSNVASASQPIDFQTNYANGSFIKAGSMYITANLKIKSATATTYGFKGSVGTSQRLFNRLFIQAGGQTVEDIQFYNEWCTNVVHPFLTTAQNENVQSALFGAVAGMPNHLPFTQQTGAASNLLSLNPNLNYSTTANNGSSRVIIPLMSSFLAGGSSGEDIPVFALSSSILIRVQLDAASNIFCVPSGDITDFELNDISLVYTEIVPDASYVATLVQAMNSQNKMYPICINTVNSFKPALSASTSVLQTINARSVNAVAVSFNPATENGTITKSGFCKANTGASNSNVGTLKLYLDNSLINQYPDGMLNAEDRLAETLTAVYSNLTDADISLPFTQMGGQTTNGGYLGQYFTNIISTQCYHDQGVVKRGMPCSQVRVDLTYPNAQSGDTCTIHTLYEKIVFFKGLGAIEIAQ
jgi:hypothetical protein